MKGSHKAQSRTALIAAALLALSMSMASAQSPAKPPAQQPAQQQKPAPQQPANSNPFPTDTSDVPVLTNGSAPSAPEPPAAASAPPAALPSDDADPVRSPDDPLPMPNSSSDSSDSLANMDKILEPPPDSESPKRRGMRNQPAPEHQETAKEDESVGSYYLGDKNWRAALSRFESAVVLDPENPDVYWGLAEAQRHLGDFANAKSNYQKVMEYDPGSKHAKEAKKLLQDPELANVRAGTNPASNQ